MATLPERRNRDGQLVCWEPLTTELGTRSASRDWMKAAEIIYTVLPSIETPLAALDRPAYQSLKMMLRELVTEPEIKVANREYPGSRTRGYSSRSLKI
jgi:hypothetical protein